MNTKIQMVVVLMLLHCYSLYSSTVDLKASQLKKYREKPVNVIIILADDLGYGDTSVAPFMGSGIFTPELEKMASRGAIMTNFHAAAAVCTPTRASILTGMFPWRLGIKGVYEYGEKFTSNRDDWLAQVPTIAMAFRDAGYLTGHSGKWHVGGMRNDDLDMRLQPEISHNASESYIYPGGKRCHHPGPNQQGFGDYVSVLDGPGAPRQGHLQVNNVLYSQGCSYLLRNDTYLVKRPSEPTSKREYLFDCEVRHAIRIIRDSLAANKPFFVQVWFHAPHGPWEIIPEYLQYYQVPMENRMAACMKMRNDDLQYCTEAVKMTRLSDVFMKYNTMVTGMDNSIGTLLNELKTLGIEKDTIVVFVSDNGPENEAGTVGSPYRSTSGLRGNKRFLYEGGIRVPCIWQWEGTIPRGKASTVLGVTTDIFPTLLDAAGIAIPRNALLDGISLLPELVSHHKNKRAKRIYTDRMSLWHAGYEGPRSTAAIIYEYKVTLDEKDHPYEIYDLLNDVYERTNLIEGLQLASLPNIMKWSSSKEVKSLTPAYLHTNESRSDLWVHRFIVSKTYKMLYDFANFGNETHSQYLLMNPGRVYIPTVESDTRSVVTNMYRKITKEGADRLRERTIKNGYCSTPCSCKIASAVDTLSLPFDKTIKDRQYMIPHGLINGTALLFDNRYYQRSYLPV